MLHLLSLVQDHLTPTGHLHSRCSKPGSGDAFENSIKIQLGMFLPSSIRKNPCPVLDGESSQNPTWSHISDYTPSKVGASMRSPSPIRIISVQILIARSLRSPSLAVSLICPHPSLAVFPISPHPGWRSSTTITFLVSLHCRSVFIATHQSDRNYLCSIQSSSPVSLHQALEKYFEFLSSQSWSGLLTANLPIFLLLMPIERH